MTIELTDEQKRIVNLAVNSGGYHNPSKVIGTASSAAEPRYRFDEVEAELRALRKIE